jgi:hypothetical protein
MAEERESGGSAEERLGAADPAAMTLALGSASRSEADAFLREQRALAAIQKHHLHEQITHLDLGIWEKRLGIALRLATLVVGIAFAGALSLMVWDAAHAKGLIVEPFSMPPELAAKGVTGQTVASQLLSNLSDLQGRTASVRTPSSYVNNWGNDFKVEIPETGISIAELTRFLRDWLGHETHITGSVTQTEAGLTVTAYVGSDMVPAVSGDAAGLDTMVRKLSEEIYSSTQPYRYAIFVLSPGHQAEAQPALEALAANGTAQDRFWANNGLTTLYAWLWQWDKYAAAVRNARALRPDSFVPDYFAAEIEPYLHHDEAALAAAKALAASPGDPDVSELNRSKLQQIGVATVALLQGDYGTAADTCRRVILLPQVVGSLGVCRALLLSALARSHDADGLRSAIADMAATSTSPAALLAALNALGQAQMGHGAMLLAQPPLPEKPMLDGPFNASLDLNPRAVLPHLALARAETGDLKGAHAILDPTPADCALCLRARGRAAALEKKWDTAAYWYERAAREAPSTPFAFTDWGRMLLDKGDADAAIAQFTIANKKGPHFADPLEFWGEALMAKNQSHLALAKFVEAEKYAPNWGRLHLKWGEALTYAGKPADARAQFARAAALDLSPSEKSELQKYSARPN